LPQGEIRQWRFPKRSLIPKVLAIIPFGSHARNVAKEISDVDIAVVVRNPDKHIEGQIGSTYSRKYDVVLFPRLLLQIQFEVLKHGKEVYAGMRKIFLI